MEERKDMDNNRQHNAYLYWKKNERRIKDRIQETFALDYVIK